EPKDIMIDELTNDIDIKTLGILEDYLENFAGVVITVSHDSYFLDKVVDELIVFEGEGKVSQFYGNYSEYADQLKTKKQSAKPAKQVEQTKPKKKKKKRISYTE